MNLGHPAHATELARAEAAVERQLADYCVITYDRDPQLYHLECGRNLGHLGDASLISTLVREAAAHTCDPTPPRPTTAADWNARYPVGTEVCVWPTSIGPMITQTRTPAWELGHGAAVVSVVGCTGGVALSHVRARQEVPSEK